MGTTTPDAASAARELYRQARDLQDRSQAAQIALLVEFQDGARQLAPWIGGMVVHESHDEQIWMTPDGLIQARVVPERDGFVGAYWEDLQTPEQIVEFLDATDVLGFVAESLAERYPQTIGEVATPSTAGGDGTATTTADIPDQIQKLAALRDNGIVTPEEFEAKKRELLNRM